MDNVVTLSERKAITKIVDETVTYAILSEGENVFTILAISGYLKAVPNPESPVKYDLSIPNEEVAEVFRLEILKSIYRPEGTDYIDDFIIAMESNDPAQMVRSVEGILMSKVSSRILTNGYVYQTFVAGLMMSATHSYNVEIDDERGERLCDICMRSLVPGKRNILIEVKSVKRGLLDRTEAKAREALDQILDRDYAHGWGGGPSHSAWHPAANVRRPYPP